MGKMKERLLIVEQREMHRGETHAEWPNNDINNSYNSNSFIRNMGCKRRTKTRK